MKLFLKWISKSGWAEMTVVHGSDIGLERIICHVRLCNIPGLYLETVPKKMSQMFLIIAQFLLVFRQNWIKYTNLFRFQALKWGTVRFSTLSELRDIDKNVKKKFFRFYTFCKKKIVKILCWNLHYFCFIFHAKI